MTTLALPRWKAVVLAALAAGMTLSFATLTTLDHLTRQGTLFLRYFGLAFVLYVVAVILVWRIQLTGSQLLLIGCFVAAVMMRAPLWFSQPTLSSDVWRYLWDGHLLTAGSNPYAERVDSPTLDPLAVPYRDRVEHQWMASPYPPAAQAALGGVYALFPESATAMQIAFSLFDLASGGILVILLNRLGRPTGRALLYLWNPLIVTEFAHSAHIDSLMTLFVLLALLWTIDRRETAGALALGLATLTKFVPALLLPAFIRRWRWPRALVYGALVVLGFVPFVGAGLGLRPAEGTTGIFGAARIYLSSWKTNDGLFFWLVEGLDNVGIPDPTGTGRILGLMALGAVGIWVLLRTPRDTDRIAGRMVSGMALLVGAYLLLSPAVFPWYLAWLIALLPLLPVDRWQAWWPFLTGWIYFSGAVNLSYLFYLDPNSPREIEWIRRVEYWPLFALLLLSLGWILWKSREEKDRVPADPRPPGRLPGIR